MELEGIITGKVPYKERDLIVKALLRNGLTGSFYVYGGQGGGKKQKTSLLELGYMIKFNVKAQRQRMEGAELMIADSHQIVWAPKNIRFNVHAYYLMCLYFELLQKSSINFHPDDHELATDHEGIFNVTSNALFYLDHSLTTATFQASKHLWFFLVKLLFHLGIMPDGQSCAYCSTALTEVQALSFIPNEGHFACSNCFQGENHLLLWQRWLMAYQTSFKQIEDFPVVTFQECDKLIQYFCHHYHLKQVELSSYRLLFK